MKLSSSLEIASQAKPYQITEIAAAAGIRAEELELFGPLKAKVSLSVLDRLSSRPNGKLICVTGMTPTKEGDGKTCTSIGLTQALGHLKKKVMLCLREPSLAPIFGYKGGATGGGYSQVLPMEDINLHFTGDFHAITSAHNLLSAVIDNHVHSGNRLRLDPKKVLWPRTMDLSDRSLREGFVITAASEVMAAIALSKTIKELKSKLAHIGAGLSEDGALITAKDLKASGAMALLIKDALKPNLVQTLEGQPVFVHMGPFANVSTGNNSMLSTLTALKLANYVVTESGFATDLGMEKLFDIVLRDSGVKPAVVVIVASIKAIQSHAGEDMGAKKLKDVFRGGFANLDRHVANVRRYGVEPVVAINRFPQDTDEEVRTVTDYLRSEQVECAVSTAVRDGGKGAVELAEKVLKVAAEKPSRFEHLYELSLSPEDKIHKIATELCGGSGVVYSAEAKQDLEMVRRLKLDKLPVHIAKTPYSLSDEHALKGAPEGWKLKVRGVRPYAGAGYLVALAGKMMLMPGLPDNPMLEQMDLTDDGHAKGLF